MTDGPRCFRVSLLVQPGNSGPHPERFAQVALGHNSKAVHRAYAKRALLKIQSLEDYEQRAITNIQSVA